MQSGSPSSSLAAAIDYQAQKANQKEERKLKRRIAEIEERLETIEARETEINEAMLTTNDFTQLADLQKELESVQTEQLELLEEWEELSERVEGD